MSGPIHDIRNALTPLALHDDTDVRACCDRVLALLHPLAMDSAAHDGTRAALQQALQQIGGAFTKLRDYGITECSPDLPTAIDQFAAYTTAALRARLAETEARLATERALAAGAPTSTGGDRSTSGGAEASGGASAPGCNRHKDCRVAATEWSATHGGVMPFNQCCHDDDCEDCFGS